MPVLIEAISVVVKKRAIEERFPGGVPGFVSQVPNQTYCDDGNLVRVGFMSPPDVQDFVGHLEACGLVYLNNGCPEDIVVVDQLQGPIVKCGWLLFLHLQIDDGKILTACLEGDDGPDQVVCPSGWEFSNSLSRRNTFVPSAEIAERLEPLPSESGLSVFRDRETGKKVFSGSPTHEQETTESQRISRIVQRVLELEKITVQAEGLQDANASEAAIEELNKDLLPEASQLVLTVRFHTAYAHYACGMVFRSLKRLEEAVEQYRISLSHYPDNTNTLLEIVRCLGEANRPQEAKQYAVHAVEVQPASPQAWGNLAMTLITLRDEAGARFAITKALELEPENAINRQIRTVFNRTFAAS
jgi:hypothetical protein